MVQSVLEKSQRENAKMLLREKFDEMATSNRGASENRSNHPGKSESEPSPKRRKNEIWDAFIEIIGESGANISEDDEIEKYLSEPHIDFHRSNFFTWWADNAKIIPTFLI